MKGDNMISYILALGDMDSCLRNNHADLGDGA